MPRTFAGIAPPLLAVLALLSPGEAVAGPPEGASGRMVFDDVADGLRKYRKEKDPERRVARLLRLAPISDPRVAVALGEAIEQDKEVELHAAAAEVILAHFARLPSQRDDGGAAIRHVMEWWHANKADLGRRAAQLPR